MLKFFKSIFAVFGAIFLFSITSVVIFSIITAPFKHSDSDSINFAFANKVYSNKNANETYETFEFFDDDFVFTKNGEQLRATYNFNTKTNIITVYEFPKRKYIMRGSWRSMVFIPIYESKEKKATRYLYDDENDRFILQENNENEDKWILTKTHDLTEDELKYIRNLKRFLFAKKISPSLTDD
ncbi:MAG: hypothetical protein IJR39_04360 [Treponema sp.]|nr:hypothetical protein [Treponema sp.]